MSKETERLRKEDKIFNNWDLADGGDKVWVEYTAPDYSRAGMGVLSGWKVYKVGVKLGDHFSSSAKTFYGMKKDKDKMMEAIKFASTLNGKKEWVKSPFGGWISKATADKHEIKYSKKSIVEVE